MMQLVIVFWKSANSLFKNQLILHFHWLAGVYNYLLVFVCYDPVY